MDDETLLAYLTSLSHQLTRIADALEILARPGQDYTPNYIKPIEEFRGFDWGSIQASVVKSDQDGPTHVSWNGQVYTRRSPVNKFDPAIWYSRASGKDENGETEYSKLITFREIKDADPLPEKARGMVGRAAVPATNGAPAGQQADKPGANAQAPATATGNGKPGATRPVAAPAAKQQPTLVPVSYAEYIRNAKKYPIHEEAAKWIAQKCGISPEDDHSRPNSYLEYFYEAKSEAVQLTPAWEILERHKFNTSDAAKALPK